MNKKITYILIVAVLFVFQAAKCKTIWQEIEYRQEDLINLYFDTLSVKTNENYVYYRTRTEFAGDDFICWIKSDCKKHLTSVLKCKSYSKEVEENFYNYKDSNNMRSFDSTSPIYLFHNKACQDYSGTSSALKETKSEANKNHLETYLKDIEKKIKNSWKPTKQNKSYEVVVQFIIEKNGNLKNLNITKSSKKPEADKAALEAVKKTAPFDSPPKEFKEESIPIEFSFVYKAANAKKKKRRITFFKNQRVIEDVC